MSLIWKGLSLGLCGVVLNFAYHGIRINANKQENIFSDIMTFDTMQIWSALVVYILFVENVNIIKLIIFTCSVVGLGWVGFALDYYSTQYTLIKYLNTKSTMSLSVYILTLLTLLYETTITFGVLYFIGIHLAMFLTINVVMDGHVGKKMTLLYP